MKERNFHGWIALVVLATGFFLAQEAGAITLIPPSLEFTDVPPGETIQTKVKLFNETAEPLTLFSQTANFGALNETGTPNIDLSAEIEDLAAWISLSKGPFAVQPGDRVEIPVEIKVPAEADPGGHYATILFSPQDPNLAGGGQVGIGQKIGTLILVRVQGDINESGAIAEFATAGAKSTLSRLPIEMFARFGNAGNVHLRPTGTVTVRNVLGGTSAVLRVNTSQGAVLPQSIRRFDVAWEKRALQEERSGFFGEIGNEWKNFAFGPYSADLELTYGLANDKKVAATIRFWVFPWRIILLVVLIIIAFLWLLGFLIKRYNRWILSRGQPPKQ